VLDRSLIICRINWGRRCATPLRTGKPESGEIILRADNQEPVVPRAHKSFWRRWTNARRVDGADGHYRNQTFELQIRRSDRLASLWNTFSGNGHEIKNPLVSLKTFAQLLPERYQDSDFGTRFRIYRARDRPNRFAVESAASVCAAGQTDSQTAACA